ncbi:unnamed protein product [Leptidea sinapis]|uniref:Uncharacterized protein n=1 Tax=Leptidea sinapis TaxID=189913 RepID=A0A5E4R3U6_9NEOP|nr:unnamed protein product [Leptidea sinapis]
MLIILYHLQFLELSDGAVLDPALYLGPSPPLAEIQDNLKIRWRQTAIPAKSAETFWPRLHSDYGLKSIHIPLQFHITGTYGGHSGTGVMSGSYASIGSNLLKTSLAGTNYGYPGLRVFGGNDAPAWSGWGNGKWGHYGKG